MNSLTFIVSEALNSDELSTLGCKMTLLACYIDINKDLINDYVSSVQCSY